MFSAPVWAVFWLTLYNIYKKHKNNTHAPSQITGRYSCGTAQRVAQQKYPPLFPHLSTSTYRQTATARQRRPAPRPPRNNKATTTQPRKPMLPRKIPPATSNPFSPTSTQAHCQLYHMRHVPIASMIAPPPVRHSSSGQDCP